MAPIVVAGYETPRAALFGGRGVRIIPGEHYPEYEWFSFEKSEEPAWVAHSASCVPQWIEHQCSATRLSLSEQSIVLNSVIDNLYKNLTELIRKRNPNAEDEKLEQGIAALFQSIRALQKQEGGLVKEVIKLHFAGPIAQGWAAIKDAEDFLENYENPSSSNTPS